MLTDYFSSEIRELDGLIAARRHELTSLPDLFPNQQSDRVGYNTNTSDANAPRPASRPDIRTIRLDLGSRQRIWYRRIMRLALNPERAMDFRSGFVWKSAMIRDLRRNCGCSPIIPGRIFRIRGGFQW